MLHPADRDQVVQAFEQAVADAVFGNAVRAGMVADRNFGDGEAVHDGQGREEPVHAGEELQLIHDGAPENFQGAAGVVHAVAGHGAAHGVGLARKDGHIIERVERLEEERKALAGDIKDIFAEAKSAGFDVKVIRQIIRIRKQEPAEVEEQETLLDLWARWSAWLDKYVKGVDTNATKDTKAAGASGG